MFPIVDRKDLAPAVVLFEVEAPRIAKRHRAGQFVIVRPRASSERIPLTVADVDVAKGTITLVVQAVGKTTTDMNENFKVGEQFHNVAGPLGNPTHIHVPGKPDDFRGVIACVAGGIGAAPMLPIARAFHKLGHDVVTILGARRADLLILKDRLTAASTELLICTDDGSEGKKGFVTDMLRELIEERRAAGSDVHTAIAIGPPVMMKFTSATSKPYGVPTLVSLNTVMVDGTGMCGGCRVVVNGEAKYVCVDGPEFDGHAVDFDGMMRRQGMYRDQEKVALDHYRHTCQMDAAANAADATR